MKQWYTVCALSMLSSISLTSCWPKGECPNTTKAPRETVTTKETTKSYGVIYLKNESDFPKLIAKGKVVVDFYADWCPPCTKIAPIIEEMANTRNDVTFIKVNSDQFNNLSQQYNVKNLPTLVFINNGVTVNEKAGFKSKSELDQLINETF